jgi:hypothetical protein
MPTSQPTSKPTSIPAFICPFYSISVGTNTKSAQQNYATCLYTLTLFEKATITGIIITNTITTRIIPLYSL